MSVATISPLHSSTSSEISDTDEFASLLEAELDSDSDSDSDSQVTYDRLKRQKLEPIQTLGQVGIQAQQISEASSSKGPCQHLSGSYAYLCYDCGTNLMKQKTALSLITYQNKALRLNQDEVSRYRDSDMSGLLLQRKLSLVLDLDHTLLHTTYLTDLTQEEEYLKTHTQSLQDVSSRNLFVRDKMMTKLRPFVHSFLKEASKMFVLYIYTMGDKDYAGKMAELLDPKRQYFGNRIISKDDSVVEHQKSLDLVLGKETSALILDDTEQVWPNDKDNLIVIERYHFFASSSKQFDHKHQSLSQLKTDESEQNGALANLLRVLKQTHRLFFEDGVEETSSKDVRSILKQVRKEILKGCKVVFSRVFPNQCKPEDHPLWRMAEGLGATCAKEVDASVTHVVAMDGGTKKVHWARKEKKFVVHRGWIDAAHYQWKKQPEEKFALEQVKKQAMD